MQNILIVPIGTASSFWIKPLIAGVTNAFAQKTKSKILKIDLEKTYNSARHQYESSQILLQLITESKNENTKTIGVVDVDLYIPVLTFVFGEAQLDGHCAVVSMHRLNNEYYGLPCDNELLVHRLVKESIHELGHTFGLLHCMNPGCIMNAATYVEDIDQKGQDFCPRCRKQLLLE